MGQVRAGGVRQDLLDDGRHHGLVVAVPTARATGSRAPKSGKKRASAVTSTTTPTPESEAPRNGFLWEEGVSCLGGLGAESAPAALWGAQSLWVCLLSCAL